MRLAAAVILFRHTLVGSRVCSDDTRFDGTINPRERFAEGVGQQQDLARRKINKHRLMFDVESPQRSERVAEQSVESFRPTVT